MAKLALKNLCKSFGSAEVIRDVSFEVSEGEFCILLGPSGCGKTTILRIIAGLEEQDSGHVFINDRDVSDLSPRERDVAMVFQNYALYPHMNVFDNMAFSLKMRREPRHLIDQRVRDAAALLGLEAHLQRKPKEISGGQRQRVAIGRAIVRKPRLFLFDEPLSNLDAQLRSSMRVELARLHRALAATTVYVTHDQIEAMTLGEKVILIKSGEIQQTGTPEDLYHAPRNLFTATFIGTPQINLVKGRIALRGGDTYFEAGAFSLKVDGRNELKNFSGRELAMGIRPEALSPGDGPLKGTLEVVEHLGPETLLHIRTGDSVFVAKAPSVFRSKIGEMISVTLGTTGIHFFENGRNIAEKPGP